MIAIYVLNEGNRVMKNLDHLRSFLIAMRGNESSRGNETNSLLRRIDVMQNFRADLIKYFILEKDDPKEVIVAVAGVVPTSLGIAAEVSGGIYTPTKPDRYVYRGDTDRRLDFKMLSHLEYRIDNYPPTKHDIAVCAKRANDAIRYIAGRTTNGLTMAIAFRKVREGWGTW